MKKILLTLLGVCFTVLSFGQFIFTGAINQIRGLTGSSYASAISTDYGGGVWKLDPSDNTSADNTGTILVDNDGHRWKRVYSGAVNVHWFGAVGDGLTDNTTVFQYVVNSCPNIFVPAGNYIVNGSLQFNTNTKIKGAGRGITILQNKDSTHYAFTWQTTVSPPNAYDITAAFSFEDFTLLSKFGFKINSDTSDFDNYWRYQGLIKGGLFRGLALEGSALCERVSSQNSAILPDEDSLEKFQGIGICLSAIFDCRIADNQIQHFGVGLKLDGCDINIIDNNRMAYNSRHIYSLYHNTFGSQNKIQNNDLLSNYRLGAIFLKSAAWHTIKNNYFECYSPAAQYITTDDDFGTIVTENRFDSPGQDSLFYMDFAPRYGLVITNNRLNPAPVINYLYNIRDTNFSVSHSILANIYNNPGMVANDVPYIQYWDYKPDIFNYQNYYQLNGISASIQKPFVRSSVTGHWVVQTDTSSLIFSMPLSVTKAQGYLQYKLTILARALPNSSGYFKVVYKEGGFSDVIYADFAGFTDQTKAVNRDFTLTLDSARKGNGYFEVELVNNQFEVEQVTLRPSLL